MTKQATTQLNAFRNLYRVKSANGRVVAFVTSHDHTNAEERYLLNGGAEHDITIEQISNGYPSDECSIYA